MTTQADRVMKYIREHPGCTTLDLLRGLDPPCTNPRARISDLRKQLEPQGLTVIGVKRADGSAADAAAAAVFDLLESARLPVSGESEGLRAIVDEFVANGAPEAPEAFDFVNGREGWAAGYEAAVENVDRAALALRAALTRSSEARTEPDWRAVVHEAMRRYHLPNDSDERVADIAIGAMEGHGFAAPRTEPAMPRPRGEWDIESTEGLDLDRSFRDRRDVRTEPEAEDGA